MSEASPAGEPDGIREELVEVVDPDGTVIDVVTRAVLRRDNLRHRCTYVSVIAEGADGPELVVHQRAAWKDVYPSYWDVCFGGIAGVGEAWEVAARRELAEEAGIEGVELADLGPVAYDADDGKLVGRVYGARYDGPLSTPDGEVVALDRVPVADIDSWVAARQVCPDSAQLALPLVVARYGPERGRNDPAS